jgi:hypothetical protein
MTEHVRNEPAPTPESPTELTAKVMTEIDSIKLLNKLAKQYAFWRFQHKHPASDSTTESYTNVLKRAHNAFNDLYTMRGDPEKKEIFRAQWGQEGEAFEQIFDGASDQFSTIQQESAEKAIMLPPEKRARVGVSAAYYLSKYGTKEQTVEALKYLGYSKDTLKKVAASFALTVATSIPPPTVMTAAAAWGAEHPLLTGLATTNKVLAVISSYALSYGAAYINARANISALRDPKIETSPNVFATIAYFILRKVVPEYEKLQDRGTIEGSIAPTVFGDLTSIGTLLLPNGATITASKNVANALIQLATAAGLKSYQLALHKMNSVTTGQK